MSPPAIILKACILALLNDRAMSVMPKENDSKKHNAKRVAIIRLYVINDGIFDALVRTAVMKCPK